MKERAMSEKLKPCARCGKAQLIDNDQDCGRGPARYSVVCDCPEWFDTEADAIAAWNRRDDRKLVETEQLLEIANHAAANALYERDRWRALAQEFARLAAHVYVPITRDTCDTCGYKADAPCQKNKFGLCRVERLYPTLVILAMAEKAGLEVCDD
jgi:hypothetical protein